MALYVVGFGPGDKKAMTLEAQEALSFSEIIVGYTAYVELVKPWFPEKEFYATPMTKEVDRCRWAVEKAAGGTMVSLVCSGDSGIYGMAGLIYELSENREDLEIIVIPGVTAAISGAALLGAPLTHDFAVISLSNLLTPWELIEKRLQYSAMCDLSICLYNPSSRTRKDFLQKACDILLRHKPGDTVCGIAGNIGREGEYTRLFSLQELRETAVDMFVTIFIGNRSTKRIGDKMVTPRGYHITGL